MLQSTRALAPLRNLTYPHDFSPQTFEGSPRGVAVAGSPVPGGVVGMCFHSLNKGSLPSR